MTTTVLGILTHHSFNTMLQSRCGELRNSIAIVCQGYSAQQVSERIQDLNNELSALEKMQSVICDTLCDPGMTATYEIKMTIVEL
jgi:hypothetical protein